MAGVLDIPNVNHRIEVTKNVDISLIKDLTNLIFIQRVQPHPIAILDHFNRPLILDKSIERPYISVDIDLLD